MNSIDPIDLDTANRLIDFSGGEDSLQNLAELQLRGAVAVQNMIADPEVRFAYLADEVGMGKTYVALGVVAMLRYFNPMLRVLYICPSKNVQEKWLREYKNFTRTNVRVNHGRIRTLQNLPATPYVSCRNVYELLKIAASGYYADFFISMHAFSLSLSDDQSEWKRKSEQLEALIPAKERITPKTKIDVKDCYARVLNYILPEFDLIVIDEAHNFKHDFESSYRNRVLSGVLGFRNELEFQPKVKSALLLSATPYDRNLVQLRNQLKMVGRHHLMPKCIHDNKPNQVRTWLKRFMVRRLNSISVNSEKLTRNMYRKEWRKEGAIVLESDEQKLVTALVQKKVGEMLTRQSHSPSFQAGLLASFESFAESTRSPPVEFDGEHADKQQTDAKDRHVIGQIADSYINLGLGRSLPHPKMDEVVKDLTENMFARARKQLVFVRRVKSVNELKNKLDDVYNRWIWKHIDRMLSSDDASKDFMKSVYDKYLEVSRTRDDDVVGGEINLAHLDWNESLPAKNDTFFAWFFRGKVPDEVSALLSVHGGKYPTPDSVRRALVTKSRADIVLMEPNWAIYLCKKEGLDLSEILSKNGERIATFASRYINSSSESDELEFYQACQKAFIQWLIECKEKQYLKPLYDHLKRTNTGQSKKLVQSEELARQLTTVTLYSALRESGLADLIPYQKCLYSAMKEGSKASKLLKLFEIHRALMSLLLRTAHGIIDLYLARLKLGPSNLNFEIRGQWMREFATILSSQSKESGFSTYFELEQLARQLELIIKNNIPDIYEKRPNEFLTYLSHSLTPVSPAIGASGSTSGQRSSQARKFRMPGYPLALVSTDVFQEGEDLHTFCDSVVHYGLSSLPIDLEQKAGRVDRVSSKAERRLLALPHPPNDEDFIQVKFPYVKESIEMLQIRQICKNYNKFINSLDDVVPQKGSGKDIIDVNIELASREEIQEQIRDRLVTPFTPDLVETSNIETIKEVEKIEENRKLHVKHVCELLNQELGEDIPHERYYSGDGFKILDQDLTVKLISARASGELLLSLKRPSSPSIALIDNRIELKKLMKKFSWQTFHRTFAIKSSDRKTGYELYFDTEMFVGDQHTTQPAEIKKFFERMELSHDPESYKKQLPRNIEKHLSLINEKTKIPFDRFAATKLKVFSQRGVTTLKFIFRGSQHIERTQRVEIYVCDDRCIFTSKATSEGFCEKLAVHKIIEYTWIRNRQIDLVEFLMLPNWSIVGRVVHPIEDMQWEEFIFCAYTLAVETDRLEYLLNEDDQF